MLDAAEIRSLYVETLARSDSGAPGAWERMPEEAHESMRRRVVPYVDALEAAGLLPAESRWKTSGEGGDSPGWSPDRASAVASWDRVQEECADMVGDWEYEKPILKREFTTGWAVVSE